TWQGLVEGRSGIGPIRLFDASSFETRLAGEIVDFQPEPFVTNRRNLRMMTRNDQLALAGATVAVRDSGLDTAAMESERIGLFVGSNKEISNPMSLLDGTLVARNEDGSVDIRRLGE